MTLYSFPQIEAKGWTFSADLNQVMSPDRGCKPGGGVEIPLGADASGVGSCGPPGADTQHLEQ